MGASKDPIKRARQLANLHPMKKGQRPPNAGRPRSAVRRIMDEMTANGFTPPSKNDIRDGLMLCAFATEEQIKSLVMDKNRPMALRVIAKHVLSEEGYGAIEKILDRTIGKIIDITTNGKDMKPEPLIVEVIDKADQVDNPEDQEQEEEE